MLLFLNIGWAETFLKMFVCMCTFNGKLAMQKLQQHATAIN